MSLPKSYRLKSRTSINLLFEKRNSVRSKFLVLFLNFVDKQNDADPDYLFSVVVPKKKIKTAVKRNLIKRRISEAFRLNQDILVTKYKENKQLHIMIVYQDNKVLDYNPIAENVILLLNRIR